MTVKKMKEEYRSGEWGAIPAEFYFHFGHYSSDIIDLQYYYVLKIWNVN